MSVAMAALVLVSLCAVGASTLSVSAAQSSSSNVQAPVVGAPVGAGAPGVCSVDGKGLDLFIRGGSDNALYMKTSPDGVTWTATSPVVPGGVLGSAPAATSPGTLAVPSKVIEVFVAGSDARLYELISLDSGSTWSKTWIPLGGQLLANTGPSACSWLDSSSVLHTIWFVTGTDHHCYYATQTGSGAPSGWINLGTYVDSAPAATATSDGSQIGLFVVGSDGAVYYKHYTPTGWDKSWNSGGGQVLKGSSGIYTSPAAYNWGASQLGWLVTGTDSNLYRNWVSTSGSIAGYEGISAVLTSSPSTTAKAPGVIDVFGRGSSGSFAALYQISYNYRGSGTWGTWTAIGGV